MYFNKGRHIRIFHKISCAMGQIKDLSILCIF